MNKNEPPTRLKILEFSPENRHFFEQLNRSWIERYFSMEPLDYLLLQNPETEIIEKGGLVLFAATDEDEIIGTVALKNEGGGVFELSKMAVDEKAQGAGAGQLLGEASLAKAREMGARKVILYTNSILQPAINLYLKLGFRHVPSRDAEYTRADVKMEIDLQNGER